MKPYTRNNYSLPSSAFKQLILLCSLLLSFATSLSHAEQYIQKSQAKGSVQTGEYRNLFTEVGHSPQAVKQKVNKAFQQLFHGDKNNETLYYPSGKNSQGDLAYIYDVNSGDVRSEGMSYGMMIAVQLNKKKEFDAIWNWSKTYMYHSDEKHPAKGFFSWSVKTNGVAIDELPAPDGEAYFVTALYFAATRWGNGAGIYNYSKQADKILTDMRHRKPITGMTVGGEKTAGNIFHPEHAISRFTPDLGNANHTDPSYHLPAFYQIWAQLGPKNDRDFWLKAANASRAYFVKTTHPKTALSPEYANFDGSPWAAPWHSGSKDFRYDAWRTAMNWSIDWSWWAVDTNQPILSDRLQDFFAKDGINNYASLYTLSGEKLNDNRSVGIIAMNATASLAATKPLAQQFVQALWHTNTPTGKYRYYDGMLYMMALLHCSGEFKAWLPNK